MRIPFLLFMLFALLACSQKEETAIPFNSSQWMIAEGQDFPYRDAMLADLVESRMLKTMNREEVLTTLGEPTRTDGDYLFYLVKQERLGFFPIHTKTLVIKLLPDGNVEWVKVHQ